MASCTDSYSILWAEEAHLAEILSFLHENFDKEETMLKSLRDNSSLSKEEAESMRIDHERLIRAIFAFSPCLIAVENSSKRIIGVNLMIVSKSTKFENTDSVSAAFSKNPPTTRLMKQYFDYLSEIGEEADLYARFPDSKAAAEFYAVAVDRNYRRMGLARRLMDEGIAFVRNTLKDVGFIFGVYTSVYSKKAAEKLGLRSVMDVDLLKYKDAEGRAIFEDTPPHNIVSVMALHI